MQPCVCVRGRVRVCVIASYNAAAQRNAHSHFVDVSVRATNCDSYTVRREKFLDQFRRELASLLGLEMPQRVRVTSLREGGRGMLVNFELLDHNIPCSTQQQRQQQQQAQQRQAEADSAGSQTGSGAATGNGSSSRAGNNNGSDSAAGRNRFGVSSAEAMDALMQVE